MEAENRRKHGQGCAHGSNSRVGGRNLVVCIDGTSNKFSTRVESLFRFLFETPVDDVIEYEYRRAL